MDHDPIIAGPSDAQPACDGPRAAGIPSSGCACDVGATTPVAVTKLDVSAAPAAATVRRPARRMRVGREGIFPW